MWSTGFGSAAARAERNVTAAHRGETHDASLHYRGKGLHQLRLRDGRNSEMVRRAPESRAISQHWQRHSQRPREVADFGLRGAVSLNQDSEIRSEDYNATPYRRRPDSSGSDSDDDVQLRDNYDGLDVGSGARFTEGLEGIAIRSSAASDLPDA